MKDRDKTKEQLIEELGILRRCVAELEGLESDCERAKYDLAEKHTAELIKINKQLRREITDHERTEEKLDELYQVESKCHRDLEEQIRRRVEFTRALVHELKTPLTPMVAACDLLIAESPQEPLLSLARKIERGACNLDKRIDELLDLARGEISMLKLQCKWLDPLKLLKGIVDDIIPEILKNGHTMVVDLPLSLPQVWADEDRIREVVLNLINNSVKFTFKGGQITLKARVEETALIVEVHDTGCGIDEEEQKRLFEPYNRLESDREHLSGLGLGLALSKMLIALHDGEIWVKSQKAKGSVFGFYLPLKDPEKCTQIVDRVGGVL